jgi:hypothetical protein
MDENLTSFLLTHGGPILRWLTAAQLAPGDPTIDREALYADLLANPEVRRWLDLLGSGPVHHSKDSSVENVLAKLGEYGLRAGMPEMDERALPYCAIGEGEPYHDEALILVSFLVRAGYAGEARVASWLDQRIEVLYDQACRADYDLYMSEVERQCLPPSQRDLHGSPKLFYQLRFNNHWSVLGLPTCYDLYAFAYLPKSDLLTQRKVEAIITYLLHPDFQETPGGYIWNPSLRRSYATGRVFLACLPLPDETAKLVMFLEMLAQFECGRASDWFLRGMAHLETFRTGYGTYCFPAEYLSEKSSYYLYAGMHMGLGEWPRNLPALELESTFRMLRLKKNDHLVRIPPQRHELQNPAGRESS